MSLQPIRKCVIPAAGLGTRFLPATKALPKEMFPIIDKPVMQILVEEAISAGCEEIIIVTGRSKRAIEDHFDSNFELEERLDKSGKFDYLKIVKGLNNMANIVYVRQPYPRGDGDAILRTKNLIGDEPFLVLFGDDIIDAPVTAAQQLVQQFEKIGAPIIANIEVSDNEISQYGVIEGKTGEWGDNILKVEKFLEKPSPNETLSRIGVIGKYILTPDIFGYLESVPVGKDGELRLADAFEQMRQKKDVFGYMVHGERFDTGSKIGFLKATLHFALKEPSIGPELHKYLVTTLEKWKS